MDINVIKNKIKCFFGFHNLVFIESRYKCTSTSETIYFSPEELDSLENDNCRDYKVVKINTKVIENLNKNILYPPSTREYNIIRYFICKHCNLLIEVEYNYKGEVLSIQKSDFDKEKYKYIF
jgi:hypothetical protein